MAPSEPLGQSGRLLVAVILLAALLGLSVWFDAVPSSGWREAYHDEDAFGPSPEAFLDERVTAAGTVVDTDPLTLEISHRGGESRFVVEGYAREVSHGEYVRVMGTLEDESTIRSVRYAPHEPWEDTYMYVVSTIGGLWVVARFFRGWGFDRRRLAFDPRTHGRSIRAPLTGADRTDTSESVDHGGDRDG